MPEVPDRGPAMSPGNAAEPGPAPPARHIKVLYLFAGLPRDGDMTNHIKREAKRKGYAATVTCVDIGRSPQMDFSRPGLREQFLQRLRAEEFDAVLLSPPCSTFSRAVWANFKGPRPVRSYTHPRGYQKLWGKQKEKAVLGTIFADFAWDVATVVAEGATKFLAFEQPEDLGKLQKGPYRGSRPASMSKSYLGRDCGPRLSTRQVLGFLMLSLPASSLRPRSSYRTLFLRVRRSSDPRGTTKGRSGASAWEPWLRGTMRVPGAVALSYVRVASGPPGDHVCACFDCRWRGDGAHGYTRGDSRRFSKRTRWTSATRRKRSP